MDLEKNWPAPLQCKNHRDRNGQPVSSFFFHLPKYCPAQQPKSQTLLRFKKQRTRKKTKNMVTKVFTQYFCRTKGCEKKWLRFPVFRAETWNVHRLARFFRIQARSSPPHSKQPPVRLWCPVGLLSFPTLQLFPVFPLLPACCWNI